MGNKKCYWEMLPKHSLEQIYFIKIRIEAEPISAGSGFLALF